MAGCGTLHSWGGVNLSLPFFADRASGKHQVGFFPSLVTQRGAGSFEAGGAKYAMCLAGGSRLAQEMRTAWTAPQQEAGVGVTCPLGHLLVESVVLLDGLGGRTERKDGKSPPQLQRLLTREVEHRNITGP
jgi:hypothetical protein